MGTLKRVLAGVSAATVMAGVSTVVLYRRDMATAHERVCGHSQVLTSPYGDIEFSQGGSGPDVLVVHGSGGGFDQGQLLVRAVLDDHVHWIAPSRFGYLRSTFQPGAGFDDQAHAYAHLLDGLGIARVAVVALSHGGPSALLFAALHPERVTSLTLISAGVVSSNDAAQQQANRQFAAASIPGARLVGFERGGHLLLVVEQAEIRSRVGAHIVRHAVDVPSAPPR